MTLTLNESGEVIIKVVNTAAATLDATINLSGVGHCGAGKTFVISGDPLDVNSIQEPNKVATREEVLNVTSPTFDRTFPAHSITLLRFPAKK
ncbi:MAG: alpha-L-arabinofuranosidase C-terminal domain-containing protein [Nibricoccus sp.]